MSERNGAALYRRWRSIRIAEPPRRRGNVAVAILAGLAATLLLGMIWAPLGGFGLLATLLGAWRAARMTRGGTRTARGGWFGPCPHCGIETALRDRRRAAAQRFACHACGGPILFRERRFVAPPQAVSSPTMRQTISTS